MAVSRCLHFWKSEYITVINALLSKYSTEAAAQEGESPASWQEGRWIEGEESILGLAASGRGFLARVSSLGDFWLGDSPSFLMRCWGVVGTPRETPCCLAHIIRLALGKTGRQMTQALSAHLPPFPCWLLCLVAGLLSRPRFLPGGPRFSGLLR